MRSFLATLSLFLIGAATPVFAQEDQAPAAPEQEVEGVESGQVVYPRGEAPTDNAANDSTYEDIFEGSGLGMMVTVLGYVVVLGAFGFLAWYLFRRGFFRKPFSKGEGSKLEIKESRMLGNRQFLMVVEYEDNKILLGVGPNKIDYLTSLDSYREGFPKLDEENQQ